MLFVDWVSLLRIDFKHEVVQQPQKEKVGHGYVVSMNTYEQNICVN